MAEAKTLTPYEEALEAFYALGRERKRFDSTGNRFHLLFDYIKILDLEEAISLMKIIHVAGTKGKGSTCTFTESILRNCGFRTGLLISPPLTDVRECLRLDGVEICKEKFMSYFWWCYDRLKEKTTENLPMPDFSRFRALLALKIFAAEKVDAVILEIGLGGRFCPTNAVQTPVVCGITSLGYDHMEILGNTLGEIAWHKAGILKRGVPAFTVSQSDEARRVLEEEASKLHVPLRVASPLDASLLNGLKLRLQGEHQYINAGLAVALSSTWLQRTGHLQINYLDQNGPLPEQFIKGLSTANLEGRAQIFPVRYMNSETSGDLVFYLDAAHTPESLEVCAKWFSQAIKHDNQQETFDFQPPDISGSSNELSLEYHEGRSGQNSAQILLFNCMSVRDPQLLLPRLMKTCASHGVYFKKALFVPFMQKLGFRTLLPTETQVGLSWQFNLQRMWEDLIQANEGEEARNTNIGSEGVNDDTEFIARSCENSMVFSTLPLAIKWLRDSVQQSQQSLRFQVLVTGSLHLVGDVLKLAKSEGSYQ